MLNDKQTKSTLICDKCGRYGEKNMKGPFESGSLHIRKAGWNVSFQSDGVGGKSRRYDLCRHCVEAKKEMLEPQNLTFLAHWSAA